MSYSNTDILFASLVGSKVNIPRFNIVQNELVKRVLPPIPFLPFKNQTDIAMPNSTHDAELWQADVPPGKEQQFFPLTFVDDTGQEYTLPYEPLISISGKNQIVRRNVAKVTTNEGTNLGGTIKERWSRGDFEITITGVLIGSLLTGDVSECFPISDFEKLRDILTKSASWEVYCDPLQLLEINRIVIEDFSFPFTKGENVQAYEIKAYSDHDYKLLLDIND